MALGIKQFDIILNRKLLNNLECTFLFTIVIIIMKSITWYYQVVATK